MKQPKDWESTAIQAIVTFLAGVTSATRKEILAGALSHYHLTETEKLDLSPNGTYNQIRSNLGSALNALCSQAAIIRKDGVYVLAKDRLAIVQEAHLETQIRALLTEQSYRREDLIQTLSVHFKTHKTPLRIDDMILRSMTERILSRLLAEGDIIEDRRGKLSCDSGLKELPTVPIQEQECRQRVMDRLVRKGGKNFEKFMSNTLEKYFLVTGRDVTRCENTGGSNDGGIDIEIDTVDELGFIEHIYVQTKCRNQAHVTEKEVREFYGALNARKGSRGIYVTTTNFHYAAKELLDSLDDCVGIDGDHLFEILKKIEYGIHKTKSGYLLDTEIL